MKLYLNRFFVLTARQRDKDTNTKTFLIATIFFWQNCKDAKTFASDDCAVLCCTLIVKVQSKHCSIVVFQGSIKFSLINLSFFNLIKSIQISKLFTLFTLNHSFFSAQTKHRTLLCAENSNSLNLFQIAMLKFLVSSFNIYLVDKHICAFQP